MRASQVSIGRTYAVKVSGRIVPVRLESVCSYGGWNGRNLESTRSVRVKTAGRLRFEIEERFTGSGSDKRWFRVPLTPELVR